MNNEDLFQYSHIEVKGELKLSIDRLANHLIEKYSLIGYQEELYFYDGGVYKIVAEESFKQMVIPYLFELERKPVTLKNIYQLTMTKAFCENGFVISDKIINVKNCLIDITDVNNIVVREHTKEYRSSTQLAASFVGLNVTLDDAPYFKQYLMNYCKNDEDLLLLLQEILGTCLVPIAPKEVCFLFGRSDSGKTGYMIAIEYIVGEENIAHISPHDFSKQSKRFEISSLYNKLVNIIDDMSSEFLKDDSLYKMFTGGGSVTADRKYKKPISFHSTCTNVFGTNSTLKTRDTGKAIVNRTILADCNKPIPKNKQIKDFYKKFECEKDVLLSWALQGLIRFKNNDMHFTIPQSTQILMDEYIDQLNPCKGFIENYAKIQPCLGQRIPVKWLYVEWENYCHVNGINNKKDLSNFRSTLANECDLVIERRKASNKEAAIYKGYGIQQGANEYFLMNFEIEEEPYHVTILNRSF